MKNDLSKDEVLKRLLLLLKNYEYVDIDDSFELDNVTFVRTSDHLYSIYNTRYHLQKEVTKVETHKGWEVLLEGLARSIGNLVRVSALNSSTKCLLVFTDPDITEIIGVLEEL